MARHSKNNTAHSIFTQGEKSMIHDWGTVRQRLGEESFKKLDQCFLCLDTAQDPVVCSKGHLFCKECAAMNFLEQKERNKRLMARWEQQEQQAAAKLQEAEELRTEKLESEFRSQQDFVPSASHWKAFEDDRKYGLLTPEEQLLARARDNIKEKRSIPEESLRKEEMIKQSFWVPEVAPTALEEHLEKPDMHTVCPVAPKHHCKMKKLVKVLIQRDDGSGSPQCWACLRVLTHHSAGVLRLCGHLLCSDCASRFCTSSCSQCSTPCTSRDFIPLVSKGTMFAAHNAVEATIKKPVFIC